MEMRPDNIQQGKQSAEPLVTLIMPCYNIAPFVRHCVESLLAQTYTNWELIAVDDGSSDDTGAVLDTLAAEEQARAAKEGRASRIRVIHTSNQGAPAARNLAMEQARGTYTHFIDGDDWVEPTMLADEVQLAEKYQLQLVVSGFLIETYWEAPQVQDEKGMADFLAKEAHLVEEKSYRYEVFKSQEAFRRACYQLFDQNLLYTPWNKLFLTSYIHEHNLQFQATFWDDFPFVLDYIRDVERVGVIPKTFYHFLRLRQESETARWRDGMYEKREEEHGWMENLYKHWGLIDDANVKELLARRYVERLVGCVENIANPACGLSFSQKRAEIRRMISTPQVAEALQEAHPRSFYMKMMLGPIRLQAVLLVLLEGRAISAVKRRSTRLFATLKAHR